MLFKDLLKFMFKDSLSAFVSLSAISVFLSLFLYFGRGELKGEGIVQKALSTLEQKVLNHVKPSHSLTITRANSLNKENSQMRKPASIRSQERDTVEDQRRDRTGIAHSETTTDQSLVFDSSQKQAGLKKPNGPRGGDGESTIEDTSSKTEQSGDSSFQQEAETTIVDFDNDQSSLNGEDTSNFSQVGSNSDESINESSNSFTCSYDRAQGTYSTSTTVSISCSESAQIHYCVQVGAGACDPLSSPTLYSGPITIGPADNTYKLSFYGSNSSSSTSVEDLTYVIDSSTPSLTVNFPKLQLQTTELPLLNHTQSLSFGKPQHFYHQYNFKSHNPTSSGLNWSCADIVSNYSSLATPAVAIIQGSFDISVLSVADQINQSVDLARLEVGDNYIVTVIEDRSRNVFTCQTQNIKIADFPIQSFSASGATPVSGTIREVSGQFQSYGHFQSPPTLTSSGSSESDKVGQVLEHGQMTISH